MVEERGSSQSWTFYLAGSGLIAVLLEVNLGIVFLEQAFSHSPTSFHHAASLFSLCVALLIAPLPWFIIRKGCKSLRGAMLEMGACNSSISTLEGTMGGILTVTYVALISCTISLARLS